MHTIAIEDQTYLALEAQAIARGTVPDKLADFIIAEQIAKAGTTSELPPLSVEERLKLLKSMIRPISDHVDYSRDSIYP